MRVTIDRQLGEHVTLKIEGRIAGLRVPELHRAWEVLEPSLGERALRVDICGVTHVDESGQNVLAEIHARSGAKFLADTPLTKYFAEQAEQSIRMKANPGSTRRQS